MKATKQCTSTDQHGGLELVATDDELNVNNMTFLNNLRLKQQNSKMLAKSE